MPAFSDTDVPPGAEKSLRTKIAFKRLPPLTALRAFEVVGRHQQLKSAAEELMVTSSAVSRQIKLLEDRLGVKLFNRNSRTNELTDLGRLYSLDLLRIFENLANATRKISEKREISALNVCTSMMSFTQRWLMPRLYYFQDRHSHLNMQLTTCTDIGPDVFDSGQVDIGITRQAPQREDLASEILMLELLVVVCKPCIVKKQSLNNIGDIVNYRLITSASRPEVCSLYLKACGVSSDLPVKETKMAHFFLAIEAVANGLGLAIVPLPLVLEDLRTGRLVAPLNRAVPSGYNYYVVYQKESHKKRKESTSHFIEWLKVQADTTSQEIPSA